MVDSGKQLEQNARFLQVEREFRRYHLDILGLSEIRWLGKGEYRSPSGEAILLYSGKEEGSKRESGVGLLLTKETQKSLMSWEAVNDRIITARFHSRVRNVTIIQCYAPTNEASSDVKDRFYSELSQVFEKTNRGDIKMVMGDLNAKVGRENYMLEKVMGRHGLGVRNDNGERFIDYCNTHQLVIGGTIFQHKPCHKISWVSTDRRRTSNQIDHFAICSRFRACLSDVRNRRGADIGYERDHHLMIAEVQLKTAAATKKKGLFRPNKYHTAKLKDPALKRVFAEQLRNTHVETSSSSPQPENMWNSLKEAYRQVGDNLVGMMPKGYKAWMSDGTWAEIEERKKLKAEINVKAPNKTSEINELEGRYRLKQKQVQRSVRRDRRRYLAELATQAETAATNGDSGTVYKITKTLSGRSTTTQHPVKRQDGTLLTTPEEEINRWKEHFQSVLNVYFDENENATPNISPPQEVSRIRVGAPTKAEVVKSIKALPNNKAAGIDGIPAEFFKACPEISAEKLLPLINFIWENESFPAEMKDGIIIKLPKKGDLTQCNNWRGICVLPIASKIIARIILERVKTHLESKLDDEQAGFRAGSSCIDHINTLRIIIEQCVEFRSPLHLLFIDFEKAFDSVRREYIWTALKNKGIPEKIIAIIKASYDGATCRVLHRGKLSEQFEVLSGVRQGCLLSPLLFLIVIGDVLRAALPAGSQGIRWELFKTLKHLDYADDITLLSHRFLDLAHMVQGIEREGIHAGLKINGPKTKIMSVVSKIPAESHQSSADQELQICVGGQTLEKVNNFTYLGSKVSPKGGTEEDVESRIQKAKGSFGMLAKIWRSNQISLKTKLRLFDSNVKSVLLYGCTTWKMTNSISNKLQVFINRCLRRILKIYWPNTISNEELWRRTGQMQIDTLIRKRKYEWIGHLLRKEGSKIAKEALWWNPHTSQKFRKQGRPSQTWRRTVEAELASVGINKNNIAQTAKNKVKWRVGVIQALCPYEGG
jgi:hypothetical protein